MAQQRMLSFVAVEQQTPDKREADERRGDFHEIYADFIAAKANEQSSRCSQCGVPFCQTHCPLGNNIPDWLMLTANGRLEEAYEISAATSNMPEICGRICPQDRLCEGNCVIEQSGHGTVIIGAVERYITDKAWEEGWVKPLDVGPARGQSVGIIGAGPAGLSAAERLRVAGYEVTVYDRHDRAGGLLIYGIPGFKLEKDVVARRTDRLAAGGIEFRLNFEVGRDATLPQLRERLASEGLQLTQTSVGSQSQQQGTAQQQAGADQGERRASAGNSRFGEAANRESAAVTASAASVVRQARGLVDRYA